MREPIRTSLPINTLSVDLAVQRRLDRARVSDIARHLHLPAIGSIVVSERDNGDRVIIDGQHRAEALREAGHTEYLVDAYLYHGLTVAEEGRLFRLLNHTKAPTSLQDYRMALLSGDETAMGIHAITSSLGWEVAGACGPGRLVAISSLTSLYKSNALAAEQTLGVLTGAWGREGEGVRAEFITGIGNLLLKYGSAVDLGRLSERLSEMKGGPVGVLGRAAGLAPGMGVPKHHAVTYVVVQAYNRNLRTRLLPAWA